ncbi:copper resistance protein A [mine drainage metagenome]|uniref:Copper resistance protein A n=1 Tax=mine drainage metagenome TaxID=410659 RepID=T0ZFZ4_9ZZZZ
MPRRALRGLSSRSGVAMSRILVPPDCPTVPDPARRRFVQGLALGAAALGVGLRPRFALAAPAATAYPAVLSGTEFDLTIGDMPVDFTGRAHPAIVVNRQLPAPILRWREGDTVTLRVRNTLPVTSSIHWHGILLPFQMDGVPGLSFPASRRARRSPTASRCARPAPTGTTRIRASRSSRAFTDRSWSRRATAPGSVPIATTW